MVSSEAPEGALQRKGFGQTGGLAHAHGRSPLLLRVIDGDGLGEFTVPGAVCVLRAALGPLAPCELLARPQGGERQGDWLEAVLQRRQASFVPLERVSVTIDWILSPLLVPETHAAVCSIRPMLRQYATFLASKGVRDKGGSALKM